MGFLCKIEEDKKNVSLEDLKKEKFSENQIEKKSFPLFSCSLVGGGDRSLH